MGEVYKTFQDFCLYDIANKCKSQSKWSKLTTCTFPFGCFGKKWTTCVDLLDLLIYIVPICIKEYVGAANT